MEENNTPQSPNESENDKGSTRRNFLKNLGLAGVGVATGAAALYSGHIFEAKKEVSGDQKILLTQDGKLVQVDSLEIKAMEKTGVALHTMEGREGIPGRRWVMVTDEATNILAYAQVAEDRDEVARRFGNPGLIKSGWRIAFHQSRLTPGVHRLTTWLFLPAERKALKLLNDFEVAIPPDG